MSRGKPLTIAGRCFATRKDADEAVKSELNRLPIDEVCESTFLQAVVNEHHPDVIAAGQRSDGRFRYLSPGAVAEFDPARAKEIRGGKMLVTYFTPVGRWEDVTVYPWRKSIDPSKEIIRALREKAPVPLASEMDQCAHEGCKTPWYALEYDHVSPTFKEIAAEAMSLMTAGEIASRFGYSKFSPSRRHLSRCIPDDHPAIIALAQFHERNEWRWVCPRHHRNVGAARRAAA